MNFLVASGPITISAHQGPLSPLQKHQIGIFRNAVKYFIRNI